MSGWEFWIDRGGTFTDVVARRPDGTLLTHKMLSDRTAASTSTVDAAVEGIRTVLAEHGQSCSSGLAALVDAVRMGTTVATNALLTRAGERTLLVVTKGFADALRIGYQNRPRIFDRRIRLPEPLHERVLEVDERVAADGTVLVPVDLDGLEPGLRQAYHEGIRSVAVLCLHGHLYPEHERRIGELAYRVGFTQISLSSEVSALTKLVSRGDTTVADAYLSPILRRYVDQVAAELAGVRLMFMQSNGGLTDARHFRGKDAILSGPAGGIVGMARMSELAGFDRVIGFDMGGTSTDVSHYAGGYERVFHTVVDGVRLRSPMLDIHTVAAGGGSILHFDGARYRVGPDSAGAVPGPACYRNGGPLTVTDANVMLGRIQPDHFPPVFGPNGDESLDVQVVRTRFAELASRIHTATGDDRTPEEVAEGFLRIAVANMANAVTKISVQKGHDVTEYALTTFGGAGGQHACAVAESLGISTVLVPPMPGVLSALGIGLADTTANREQSVESELDAEILPRLEELAGRLERDARAELTDEGITPDRIRVHRRAHLRYDGTDTALLVPLGTKAKMTEEFEAAYRRTYALLMDRPLVVEAVSVEAVGLSRVRPPSIGDTAAGDDGEPAAPHDVAPMYADGRWHRVPLYDRDRLGIDCRLDGPAIVTERNATTVVAAGWTVRANEHGHLVLTRTEPGTSTGSTEAATGTAGNPGAAVGAGVASSAGVAELRRVARSRARTDVDPVLLEVFNNLFMSIAEQMGVRLEATAQSVNIKERLDFSCAIFDPNGSLIANAPHIPVHLGSMGRTVQEVIRRHSEAIRPGHIYAVNDPFHGGTHLPDVTVVTPVYDRAGAELLFFIASRGHHAEIGGITPGSMPAFSRTVQEEGVLFDTWLLVDESGFREQETIRLLADAPYPSRNIPTNLADLRAQIAASEKGVHEVQAMIDHFGLDVVQAYMGHVQDNAEAAVRRVISGLSDGDFGYEMDSGARIQVSIRVDREAGSARIDFTGSSAQLDTNFNAPESVATAAVLYVFRTLVDDDIPLNDGCLRPIEVIVPEGSFLAPRYPAAVVAGNVETSQALTGALYAALGVQAEGSGTMNNLTFGNDHYQYYETIGSGAGAGDGFDGASVVQTHMTNSRLTDPEVLESRFPVRLEEFSVRTGSGGAGRWRGGDGALRRIRFLEPMTLSTLSGHRRVPPYGMAGGEPGDLGRHWVERADGSVHSMQGADSVQVEPGDVLVLHTPGGGGYGPPTDAE